MEAPLVVAVWLFVVTHVDTLAVLVAFCTDEEYYTVDVFVGHYLGFAAGLIAAILGAFLVADVLREWAFLLGILPLGLGLWGFARRSPDPHVPELLETPDRLERVVIVATAGLGLSGENVAAYVPFFLTLQRDVLGVVIAMYVVGGVAVFLVAMAIARRTAAMTMPEWVERFLVPAMLVIVGLHVLTAGWLAV